MEDDILFSARGCAVVASARLASAATGSATGAFVAEGLWVLRGQKEASEGTEVGQRYIAYSRGKAERKTRTSSAKFASGKYRKGSLHNNPAKSILFLGSAICWGTQTFFSV